MAINSEIGKLRKVIVHRPLVALRRLTPSNCHDMLFDDVIYPEKAAKEHKAFETILEDHGAEVYLLQDLLQETMEDSEAKEWLVKRLVKRLYGETVLTDEISNALLMFDTKTLTEHLISGITCEELKFNHRGLAGALLEKDDFIVPPLPNSFFTRDTSCWIGNGVSINPMYWPARRGETLNIAAIYKFHPLFTNNEDFDIWYDGSDIKKEYHPIEEETYTS